MSESRKGHCNMIPAPGAIELRCDYCPSANRVIALPIAIGDFGEALQKFEADHESCDQPVPDCRHGVEWPTRCAECDG